MNGEAINTPKRSIKPFYPARKNSLFLALMQTTNAVTSKTYPHPSSRINDH